jgi:hypothetical protein
MEELRALVEPRIPGAGGGEAIRPRVYLLFDDYDLATGPMNTPLTPLLDLLPLGREIGLHVVLARRVAGSARGAYEPGFQRVRELGSPGLIMSGDPRRDRWSAARRPTACRPAGRCSLAAADRRWSSRPRSHVRTRPPTGGVTPLQEGDKLTAVNP